MWLDVAASNNDPFHVCTNFADTVISLGGIPYVIRADRGTENGNIEMMQTYLRSINRDARSSLHAVYTANQLQIRESRRGGVSSNHIVRCLSVLNVHFCKKSPKLTQMTFDRYLSNRDIGRTFWDGLTPSNLHKSKMANVKIGMVVYVLALWSSYLNYCILECRVGI